MKMKKKERNKQTTFSFNSEWYTTLDNNTAISVYEFKNQK